MRRISLPGAAHRRIEIIRFPAILYLLMILPLLFSWYAQSRIKRVLQEEGLIESAAEITGLQAARELLEEVGLERVRLEVMRGRYNDYYDPTRKILRLSSYTANSDSTVAVGIAGHEVGHAVQDAQGYGLMRIRMALGSGLAVLSTVSPVAFIGGFLLGSLLLMYVALIILGLQVVFALVTYPLEWDASRRALDLLLKRRLILRHEAGDVRRVLRAASLTYVAVAAQRLAIFLFFFILVAGAAQLARGS